jgi:hypothetical protein
VKLATVAAPVTPTKRDLDLAVAIQWKKEGLLEDALKVANRVLDEDPNHPVAIALVGEILVRTERAGLAYQLLQRALSLRGFYEARHNLAAACVQLRRLDEAKALLHENRRLRPNDEQTLAVLAVIAVHEGQPEVAVEFGEKSLAMNPNQPDVHESVGYAYLMMGDFKRGFAGYERFVGKSKYRPIEPPHPLCPYWQGEEEIDLCMRGEQGIGDEIYFASVIPEIIPRMKSVTLDTHYKLEGLFKRSFPGIEVYPTRMDKPDNKDWRMGRKWDAHCLLGSLPYHRRQKPEDFPGTPYLVADPERRLQWRTLLDRLPGKRKIGIAWSGGLANTWKERRSLQLEALLPILRTPDISWVSLQYQDPTEEIEAFTEKHGIEVKHWKRAVEAEDYEETASLVAELDLVITVTTTVAHLAGALGKECWVLVPSIPPWFFLREGKKLPWYKSVEIFRQTGNDWPLAEIAERLSE